MGVSRFINRPCRCHHHRRHPTRAGRTRVVWHSGTTWLREGKNSQTKERGGSRTGRGRGGDSQRAASGRGHSGGGQCGELRLCECERQRSSPHIGRHGQARAIETAAAEQLRSRGAWMKIADKKAGLSAGEGPRPPPPKKPGPRPQKTTYQPRRASMSIPRSKDQPLSYLIN